MFENSERRRENRDDEILLTRTWSGLHSHEGSGTDQAQFDLYKPARILFSKSASSANAQLQRVHRTVLFCQEENFRA